MIRLCAFADEAANDLQGQIDALKRHRIGYLEFRSVNGKNVADLTQEEAFLIRKKLDEAGVKVWAIGSPIGKADVDCDFEAYKKKIAHVFRLAKILGTERIRIFSFFGAHGAREKVMGRIREMLEMAAAEGVVLYHENEKGVYGDRLRPVLDILDTNPDLRCVYDPANFIQTGENAEDTLEALHSRTDYFHIKDVVAKTGELVPAGHGDGKLAELIARIEDDKVLSVEPHLALFDAYKGIDDTELKVKFRFDTPAEAFDAAVTALKKLLIEAGYKETNGEFVK